MIAVDTSALLAVALDEPEADDCEKILKGDPRLLISAATIAEALIVAGRRNVANGVLALLAGLPFEVAHVTDASARRAAAAYERWGKGVHAAALNYGDCFAYELAMQNSCKLLYIGNDFARTDVSSALPKPVRTPRSP